MARSFAGNSTDALAAVEDLQAKDLRIAFFGKTGEDVVTLERCSKRITPHTHHKHLLISGIGTPAGAGKSAVIRTLDTLVRGSSRLSTACEVSPPSGPGNPCVHLIIERRLQIFAVRDWPSL